jgi:hypothetical protein
MLKLNIRNNYKPDSLFQLKNCKAGNKLFLQK